MKKQPVHEIRVGRIKAAIWDNGAKSERRQNVTFTRIYKDGDEWKFSDSYGREDLLLLAKVADMAHSYLSEPQSQEQSEE